MGEDKLREQLNRNQPLFIGEDTAFRSAVLIPLVQIEEEWHVVFEVRSLRMRKQPGDISFPGGKIDPTDASPEAAAIRETYEELGVNPDSIEILASLSPFITSSSFVVYPFVAILHTYPLDSYNQDEVEEVFTVPLKWLLNCKPYCHLVSIEPRPSSDFPFHKIMNGAEYQWRARAIEEWFFDYEGYTIWGLTARILKYFVERLK
ncbi:NUDIX hydrolase [Ureibacillus chungkukjangi]|uniref:NUDIX domain-containing protein n=1 Tax=Ureibacillus chungkukjangi TaxID=1202712 RepID=A0A318U7K8_9BACL|nr:CoA pyrophosphatase [Ureibacillus chungkukjangi]MCM3387621.1 CoA pyrophosphatase [Ureibacillus chungkukjangi]PYF07939.1 NUDIX domain-containing protein [Ureibacillus chungkukjangi]HCG4535983.1 CoA pyrophosphatase [Salmonella enterica subsp. enterica serovar Typhi str. AG3]